MPVSLVRPKIYYELDEFYANHRDFVKSRSYDQLKGESQTISEIEDCDPVYYLKDLGGLQQLETYLDFEYDETTIANPCGLIGKYMFNDTYQILESSSRKQIFIDETGITQTVNTNYKFIKPTDDSIIQWTDVTDDYDVSSFDAKKYIYLSEMNSFGGTNAFMGKAFLVMAGITLVVMILFVIGYFVRVKDKDNFYDPDYLEW